MKNYGPMGLMVVLAACVFQVQCTRPTFVGSELVDQDQVALSKEDTFSLLLRSFGVDTFEAYRPGTLLQNSRYPLGYVEDPFLGTGKSTFYFELVPGYTQTPNFAGARVDSIVLSMDADTSYSVGEIVTHANLHAYLLTENMKREATGSQRTYARESTPAGTWSGSIRPTPQHTFIEYSGSARDTVTSKQYRIRLDNTLAEYLMSLDSLTLLRDSLFKQAFPGFAVEFGEPIGGYIGLLYVQPQTSMTLYYTRDDTLHFQARWRPTILGVQTGISYLGYSFDRGTARYPTLLNMNESSDEVHFLQGLAGHDLEIYFPHMPLDRKVIVNHAVLELTLCELDDEDVEAFGPVRQLELYTYDKDGKQVLIDDVVFTLGPTGNDVFSLQAHFGGTPLKNAVTNKVTYRCNLSAQIQKIWDGEAIPLIYARVRSRAINPERIIFCGNSTEDPPKLTITYTPLGI